MRGVAQEDRSSQYSFEACLLASRTLEAAVAAQGLAEAWEARQVPKLGEREQVEILSLVVLAGCREEH